MNERIYHAIIGALLCTIMFFAGKMYEANKTNQLVQMKAWTEQYVARINSKPIRDQFRQVGFNVKELKFQQPAPPDTSKKEEE